jgi:hypothetical protein
MRKIKLLAMGLVLSLAGFVCVAGQAQDSKQACGINKASASCCASRCQSEDSCCKSPKKMDAHRANAQQTAQTKNDCCGAGECCKGEKSCCQADQSGKAHLKAEACEMNKEGVSCCASGEGGCCDKACCSKGASKTN